MQPLQVERTFGGTPLLTVNNYYCPGTTTDCSTNNGNVLSQWIARNGTAAPWVQSFGYDGVNRLNQATETLGQGGAQSWQETYGYDAYGNRSIPSSTFSWSAMTPAGFDAATNRNSGNGWSPTTSYDSVGNVIADPMGGTYGYDAENRMVSSSSGTTYQYDGEGRRVSKSSGGVTTTYLYDASGQLLTEYGAAAAASGTQYVAVDPLGSTRLLTDAFGNLPPSGGCHDYLPFGTELTQGMAGNRGACFGGTDGVTEKFTGKERDAETGLDYFGARYFSAAQGRFTSPDPIGIMKQKIMDPQQWNMYSYARDNPLRFADPTGKYVELRGNDKDRQKQLNALRQGVGAKAGSYLYDNVDKKTGKHYVGILSGGQDGKGPSFGSLNAAANKIGGIVQDTTRGASIQFVAPGANVDGHTVGSIDQHMTPAVTSSTANSAQISLTSGPIGSMPGAFASNGEPMVPSLADVLTHELGHVDSEWYHGGQDTNGDAVRTENQARQAEGEPTRTGHDRPGDVQLNGTQY